MESQLRKTLIDRGFPRWKIESVLKKAQTLDACLILLETENKKEQERKHFQAEKRAREEAEKENDAKQRAEEEAAMNPQPEESEADKDQQDTEGKFDYEDSSPSPEDHPDETLAPTDEELPPLVEVLDKSNEATPAKSEIDVEQDGIQAEAEAQTPTEDETPSAQNEIATEPEPHEEIQKSKTSYERIRPEGGLHPLDMLRMNQQQEQQEQEEEQEEETYVEEQTHQEESAKHQPESEHEHEPEPEPAPELEPTAGEESAEPEEVIKADTAVPVELSTQNTMAQDTSVTVVTTESKRDSHPSLVSMPSELLSPNSASLKHEWIQTFDVECVKLSQPLASLKSRLEEKSYEKAGPVAEILRKTLKSFKEKYGVYKKSSNIITDFEKAEALMAESDNVLTSYDENVRPIAEEFMVKNAIAQSRKFFEPIENAITLRNVGNAARYRNQLEEKCTTIRDIVAHDGGGAAEGRAFLEKVDGIKEKLKNEFSSELAEEDIFNFSQKVNASIKAVYLALSEENVPVARKAKSELERHAKPLGEYSSNPKAAKVLVKVDETIKTYEETIPELLSSAH